MKGKQKMDDDMKLVHLISGNICDIKLIVQDLSFPDAKNRPEIVSGWNDNEDCLYHSTLRDIAIILRSMVGQGVLKQLAIELYNKLNVENPHVILGKLTEILSEYSRLSEEEAEKRWELLKNFDDLE
jgi:hypothetical protein